MIPQWSLEGRGWSAVAFQPRWTGLRCELAVCPTQAKRGCDRGHRFKLKAHRLDFIDEALEGQHPVTPANDLWMKGDYGDAINEVARHVDKVVAEVLEYIRG